MIAYKFKIEKRQVPRYTFAPVHLLQEEVEGARGGYSWDSAPPQDQDDAAPQQGGRNQRAGVDGDVAGGPDGRHGVTGKHDSSKRLSPFLRHHGLPLPSISLLPEDLGATTTPGTMLSKPFHREHGHPREP